MIQRPCGRPYSVYLALCRGKVVPRLRQLHPGATLLGALEVCIVLGCLRRGDVCCHRLWSLQAPPFMGHKSATQGLMHRAIRISRSSGCCPRMPVASPQRSVLTPGTSRSARLCPLETAGPCAARRRQAAAAAGPAVQLCLIQLARRHLGKAAAALRPAAACLAARRMPCAEQCAAGPAHMLWTSCNVHLLRLQELWHT
jgi:hypothetical protein